MGSFFWIVTHHSRAPPIWFEKLAGLIRGASVPFWLRRGAKTCRKAALSNPLDNSFFNQLLLGEAREPQESKEATFHHPPHPLSNRFSTNSRQKLTNLNPQLMDVVVAAEGAKTRQSYISDIPLTLLVIRSLRANATVQSSF